MIVAYLRMRKIAKRERERYNERVKRRKNEREKKRKSGCVTTLKKMPATRTKIKMITYPIADVRALRVTRTRTRRIGGAAEEGEEEGGRHVQGCTTVTAMFCNLN